MLQTEENTRITGKKLFVFLLITDLAAWTIIVLQDHVSIVDVMQKMIWLVWVLGVIVLLVILGGAFFFIFKTSDRYNQLIRSLYVFVPVLLICILSWIIRSDTTPSSTTPDIFVNTMSIALTGLGIIFGLLAAIAALLTVVDRPTSPQRPIIISYSHNGSDYDIASWMNTNLIVAKHEAILEDCEDCSVRDVLRKIRRHVSQKEHMILVLSPAHPLVRQFSVRCKFWLMWMQLYYRNLLGKGAFILAYTTECEDNIQRAFYYFHPINYYASDKGNQSLVDRVSSLQEKQEKK